MSVRPLPLLSALPHADVVPFWGLRHSAVFTLVCCCKHCSLAALNNRNPLAHASRGHKGVVEPRCWGHAVVGDLSHVSVGDTNYHCSLAVGDGEEKALLRASFPTTGLVLCAGKE